MAKHLSLLTAVLPRAFAGALLLALVPTTSAAAPPKCQLGQVAEIAITQTHSGPLVDASINTQSVKMLVDTGAARSGIWVDTATRLGLKTVGSGVTFYGAGGGAEARRTTVQQFGLGQFTARDLPIYVLVTGTSTREAAGILGEDFLSRLDVEFDLRANTIRLFETKNCVGDQVVYWAPSYAMVKLVHVAGDHSNWLLAHVSLNNHEVLGMFDSGAYVTVVNARAAYSVGKKASDSDPSAQLRGVGGPATTEASKASFAAVTIGQENIQNVTLAVADVFKHTRVDQTGSYIPQGVTDQPDLIIGADFFRAHRIFVANSQGKVYFTYSGGPIFAPPQRPAESPTASGETAKP